MTTKMLAATLLSVAAVGTGGSIVVLTSSSSGKPQDASETQYKPGKGCGDKNNQHDRQDECKKP
jgi:hypothetical protein